jgi:putative membrane protein
MKKIFNELIIGLICTFLLFGGIASAAEQANTPKEEIVYANLDASGAVDNVYVINRFLLDQAGTIVDYGTYKAVTNLTDLADIHQTGDTITVDAQTGNFYYQGELGSISLPWDISIAYTLDGEPLDATELAGKSGLLELSLDIRQNAAVDPVFFENYALEVAINLDSEKCRGIEAPDATISNAGETKTLSYIIFSNRESHLGFSAEVSDFTMEGIQLAGISLALSLDDFDKKDILADIDQLQKGIIELDDGVIDLKEGVIELQDGVVQFGNGVGEIADGANELYDKSLDLYDGSQDLADGADELADGIGDLNSGVKTLYQGLPDLSDAADQLADGASLAVDGMSQFNYLFNQSLAEYDQYFVAVDSFYDNLQLFEAGLDTPDGDGSLSAGAAIAAAQVVAGLNQAGYTLDQTAENIIAAAILQYTEAVLAGYSGSFSQIMDGYAALDGNGAALSNGLHQYYASLDELGQNLITLSDGIDQLADGIHEVEDGIGNIYAGTAKLKDGARELAEGNNEYSDGVEKFSDGVGDLAEGTDELKENSGELIDGVGELEDGTAELKDGTSDLRSETGDMDAQMEEKIEDLLAQYGGRDFELVSFVSEKNTQINAVQFVMQTAAVALPEEEAALPEETLDETFWDRLKSLGKYLVSIEKFFSGLFSRD